MARIKKTETLSVGEEMEKIEPSYIMGRDIRPFDRSADPQNGKHVVTIRPEIPLPGLYSRLKTYVYIKMCSLAFMQTLFIVAKKWILSKCPSTDE